MAKALTLANDSMLIGIDSKGHVRDLYYPYVGLENHISGGSGSFLHRVGVWVDGGFAWLDDPSWNVTVSALTGTMAGRVEAHNDRLKVSLSLTDVVDCEENIFIREATLTNTAGKERVIKLYFAQQFRIAEDRSGSTGFYDPRVHAVIHYKGRVTFLISGASGANGFDDYSVGLFNMESRDGTYIDALDGELSKNPIEHGSVDSVIGFTAKLAAGAGQEIAYWIAASESIESVHALHALVEKKGYKTLQRRTQNHFRMWLARSKDERMKSIDPELARLYERSLLVLAAHADRYGGIIASSDSEMLNYGRDTYSYVWPRDGAISAQALDVAGYTELARNFFKFMGPLLNGRGYLMHKYRPDGALGSSWHPWMWRGSPALPIQEDETATVLAMLWKHFRTEDDAPFIKAMYPHVIGPMTEFILSRIDQVTRLPVESYDLWEETYGTSTYTASSVYAGLVAAQGFAQLMHKLKLERELKAAAALMKEAIGKRLFDLKKGRFLKYIRRIGEGYEENDTLDISGLHGVVSFGVFGADDPQVVRMYESVERELKVPTEFGGYVRYAGDRYYRINDNAPSNPWIVTTMWIARYRIKRAASLRELESVLELFRWARRCASGTYMLPEQVDPYTGAPLSATPLVWSHAEYILALNEYLDRRDTLSRSQL